MWIFFIHTKHIYSGFLVLFQFSVKILNPNINSDHSLKPNIQSFHSYSHCIYMEWISDSTRSHDFAKSLKLDCILLLLYKLLRHLLAHFLFTQLKTDFIRNHIKSNILVYRNIQSSSYNFTVNSWIYIVAFEGNVSLHFKCWIRFVFLLIRPRTKHLLIVTFIVLLQ